MESEFSRSLRDHLPIELIFEQAKNEFFSDEFGESIAREFTVHDFSEEDIVGASKEMFREKKAFVAGPSCRETEACPQENDVTIFFALNFAGASSLPEKWRNLNITGSFYASHKLPKMQEDGSIVNIKSLDYIIVKRDVKNIGDVTRFASESSVFYSQVNYRSIHTELNAGTELLIAIVDLGFKEIELASIDLFLNSKYPSGYKSNRVEGLIERVGSEWKLENKETLRSLGLNHNPAFQYAVYEHFYRKNTFSCDAFLCEVMESGLYSYLGNLERQYGGTL